jgi:flavodoxin I
MSVQERATDHSGLEPEGDMVMESPRIVAAYGSTFGDTADAAERIVTVLTELTGVRPTLMDIAYHDLRELESFDVLLLGCSTWNIGELQSDWEAKLSDLDSLDMHNKKVGLFGSGDQLGYPDTYMDALGILAQRVEARGAELIGLWSISGYQHTASLAQRERCFVGRALDETSQGELTPSRIDRWVMQLIEELDSWSLRGTEPIPAGH